MAEEGSGQQLGHVAQLPEAGLEVPQVRPSPYIQAAILLLDLS